MPSTSLRWQKRSADDLDLDDRCRVEAHRIELELDGIEISLVVGHLPTPHQILAQGRVADFVRTFFLDSVQGRIDRVDPSESVVLPVRRRAQPPWNSRMIAPELRVLVRFDAVEAGEIPGELRYACFAQRCPPIACRGRGHSAFTSSVPELTPRLHV